MAFLSFCGSMEFSQIVFLAILGITTAIPVVEDQNFNRNPPVEKNQNRLRQDGEDGVGEIELVGEQVSQIISGVLTGNFGQIFGGSTSFIDDGDTETGVNTILNTVAQPLNTWLANGIKNGQKYYNITEQPPIILAPTSPVPPTAISLPVQNPGTRTNSSKIQVAPQISSIPPTEEALPPISAHFAQVSSQFQSLPPINPIVLNQPQPVQTVQTQTQTQYQNQKPVILAVPVPQAPLEFAPVENTTDHDEDEDGDGESNVASL